MSDSIEEYPPDGNPQAEGNDLRDFCGPEGECEEEGWEMTVDYRDILVRMREIGVSLKQLCQLPPGELALLITLSRWSGRDGEIRPSDLGREMKLSRPAISRMLRSLKEKGFLKMTIRPEDHRYMKVALTDQGRDSLEHELGQCTEVLRRVVLRMGSDDLHRMLYYNKMFTGYLVEELKQPRST